MTLSSDKFDALRFHSATPERAELHEKLREGAIQLAELYESLVPNSREASLAFTAIQESLLWANAGLAIHGIKP